MGSIDVWRNNQLPQIYTIRHRTIGKPFCILELLCSQEEGESISHNYEELLKKGGLLANV